MAIERDFEDRHLKAQRKRDIKRHRDSRPLWKRMVVWTSRVILVMVLVFAPRLAGPLAIDVTGLAAV